MIDKIYIVFLRFPGLLWYIEQRPEETKPLCDHTTGLCHLCEAARTNFKTMVNTLKRHCVCGTKLCPNFSCVCSEREEDDDETCQCLTCECQSCAECKVMIVLEIRNHWNLMSTFKSCCTFINLGLIGKKLNSLNFFYIP